jgi:hypothetical protein
MFGATQQLRLRLKWVTRNRIGRTFRDLSSRLADLLRLAPPSSTGVQLCRTSALKGYSSGGSHHEDPRAGVEDEVREGEYKSRPTRLLSAHHARPIPPECPVQSSSPCRARRVASHPAFRSRRPRPMAGSRTVPW